MSVAQINSVQLSVWLSVCLYFGFKIKKLSHWNIYRRYILFFTIFIHIIFKKYTKIIWNSTLIIGWNHSSLLELLGSKWFRVYFENIDFSKFQKYFNFFLWKDDIYSVFSCLSVQFNRIILKSVFASSCL